MYFYYRVLSEAFEPLKHASRFTWSKDPTQTNAYGYVMHVKPQIPRKSWKLHFFN